MKFLSKTLVLLLIFSHSVIGFSQTITDIVVESPDHNTLETAVIAAGLAGTLAGPGPYTVFAPTDAAFDALGMTTINALLADPSGALTNILLQHVVNGVADGSNIFDGMKISNLAGENLEISTTGGLSVEGITISVADIKASNGVVHVIDAVISKPASVVDIIVNSADHNTLETAVLAAGLQGALSDPNSTFTVFAPTDAAFAALDPTVLDAALADPQGLLTQVLTNHVVAGTLEASFISDGLGVSNLSGGALDFAVNGSSVTVNNANIIVTSLQAQNGLVHVIDAVLLPELRPASVVDVIVNSPDHTTLETAVLAAGLEGTLSDPNATYTVFAPTDAAFAALDPAVLDAALADPQGLLTTVLTYHVVNGYAEAGRLFDGQRMATLQGSNIQFDLSAGAKVNNANIIVTDIMTDNGIVHIIDAVLLP